jgi:Tol biopolymer transport system component
VVSVWSPDGRQLAVLATRPDKTFEHPTKGTYPLRRIYLYSLTDGRHEELKADPLSDNIWPRFSPDGRRLAYHHRQHQGSSVLYEIGVYDLQSRSSTDVFSFSKTYREYLDYKANGFPAWSPDTRQMVWLVPFQHWWAEPMKMTLVYVRTAGGLAEQVDLYERGLRFVSAVDWQ